MTTKPHPFLAFPPGAVKLSPGLFLSRFELNRRYLRSLSAEHLLRPHYLEAGLWWLNERPSDGHWGWESPTCQLRGSFVGHWLWAAARTWAQTGDPELKGRADFIVGELGRCQQENGDGWVGSIPVKYLEWAARGKWVWAPHYVLHKTLLGLIEMYRVTGNEQALEIVQRFAQWFLRWARPFSRDKLDDILDVETGGMLEAWADLYGITRSPEHLELVQAYDRPRLFDRLLTGEDALINMHANTTIPEVHGAARAWEVTGDRRWRDIVEAYWRLAVDQRGFYCTGGQTCGEIWSPQRQLAARLGDKTQEHCTVYNMVHLAEYLHTWTGDPAYADYIERNLYNGILAQQNPRDGMITYFLPLEAGSRKKWGRPTEDFWCCHGTLVQAQAQYDCLIYHRTEDGIAVSQYLPSRIGYREGDSDVSIELSLDSLKGEIQRPELTVVRLSVRSDPPAEFTVRVRIPGWVSGEPSVSISGNPSSKAAAAPAYLPIRRRWGDDAVEVRLPRRLSVCPLPDDPSMVAFLDGPVVLAGVIGEERTLQGDLERPETMIRPHREREWGQWTRAYKTHGQAVNFTLLPLYEVIDERYTVYFPVRGSH